MKRLKWSRGVSFFLLPLLAGCIVSLLVPTEFMLLLLPCMVAGCLIYIRIRQETVYELSKQLEETNQRYGSLFTYNPDAIISFDKEGYFQSLNESVVAISGYAREELLQMTFMQLMTEDTLEKMLHHFRLARDGISQNYECAIIHKLGHRVELRVTNVPIYVDRELVGVYAIVKDITERKRITRSLKVTQQYYHSLFHYNLDISFHLNMQGGFLDMNEAGITALGYSKEELLQTSIRELVVPEDAEKAALCFQSGVGEGRAQQCEVAVLRKDGRRLELSITSVPVVTDDRRIESCIGIARDVTEEKTSKRLLDKQNQILEMIATARRLSVTLEEIVCFVEKQTGAICSILLYDQEEERLWHGAAPNLPRSYIEQTDGLQIGPDKGSSGSAVYFRKPVIAEDICEDSRWDEYRELALRHQLRACWSIPLLSKEEVLGAFAMYYKEPHVPLQSEMDVIGRACHLARLAIEHHRTEDRIRHMAFHDALTGLPNRRYFKERLDESIRQAERDGKPIAVMFLDLDRFKHVNDSLGHRIGDLLLKEVAARIVKLIRPGDMAARQGGDEFVFLLIDADEADTVTVAGKMLEVIAQPFFIEEHEIYITPSVGISFYPVHGLEPEALMKHADNAMYQAKRQGKNAYAIYNADFNLLDREQLEMEKKLRKALQKQEFTLYYQPQVDLSQRKVIGVEALLRWNDPQLGLISPAEFIPLAEETGLIAPIGDWVIRTACEQGRKWLDEGLNPFILSVNLSIRQFHRPDFVASLSAVLSETGFPAECLELEITESMTWDMSLAGSRIRELRGIGVQIAIDDFGTGYSSLNQLKNLPIQRLKIDQSFVRDILLDSKDKDIVKIIISLSHHLGIKVIAEGVEHPEQWRFLELNRCDQAQGYLISRPMLADELGEMLKEHSAPFHVEGLLAGSPVLEQRAFDGAE